MNDVDKIIRLLKDPSIEKRIAAAIVLGELRAKQPQAIEGFVSLLDSGVPVLQRHALEALTHVGAAKKVVAQAMELLGSNVEDVRRAATAAIRSVGEDVVPLIRARLASADGAGAERRALDGILADLGGKDAFSTLLEGLATAEGEAAKAATLAVRQHVKDAGARERRSYLAETEKYLKKQKDAAPSAIAAALKILGYLEDPSAVPTLLAYATAKNQPPLVKQEAFIALRFALQGSKPNAKVVDALADAASSPDRALAHTALHTLGTLALPPSMAARFEKLLDHADLERARFAAAYLAKSESKALVKALVKAEKARAEMLAEALAGTESAAPALARALLETKDDDRAWLLRKLLGPIAKSIPGALRRELLADAEKRLASGSSAQALLDVAQSADSEAVAEALRALADRLRRAKNDARAATVLGLLLRTPHGTDEDRYALASIELRLSNLDTRPQTRAADGALSRLNYLTKRGFDVAAALRKDRSLELDHLYYVGFHFVEEGHSLGDDLLEHVVKKGGKSKVGKAARNKLSLTS